MSRLAGWFRSGGGGGGSKTENVSISSEKDDPKATKDVMAREMEDIDDAMNSASLIMNDDLDGAWEKLQTGDSSFHHLGMAVTIFMRSVLGFEKDVMAETSAKLAECEAKATAEYKKAQKDGKARAGSKLYPPGTEYELVKAETQLMGAVVGVLHESLVEAMKSFYKLRKAFVTLDGIIASEGNALGDPLAPTPAPRPTYEHMPGSFDDDEFDSYNANTPKPENGDDSKATTPGTHTPAEMTVSSTGTTTPEELLQNMHIDASQRNELAPAKSKTNFTEPATLDNPLDAFIHSGSNMCFGMLLLILTLIPPAFSRILSVVGFRGDRVRGVRMLWRSTTYPNVNGAVAGMGLLAYYNGLLGAVDILPAESDFDEDAETVGPPRQKCDQLLATMRSRYPESRLWRIEEARQMANERDLVKAISMLQTGPDSKMKQVAALNNFELSLNALYVQDWRLMRDSFLRCLEVNDWSPSIYYYMAGCASLELYRDAVHSGDADEARRQKTKAEGYFRKAPTVAGKKRFMARQLPLETFLQRKVQKWEDRAKACSVDLADAIGPSPALEVIYLWNGSRRMGEADLQRATANFGWERCTASEDVVAGIKAENDEMAIWLVGHSSIYRRMGKPEEAKALLEPVLKQDR